MYPYIEEQNIYVKLAGVMRTPSRAYPLTTGLLMYYWTLSYRVSLVKAAMFEYVIRDRSPQSLTFA